MNKVMQVTEYINVNGAQIEREFLEANVEEARSCTWEEVPSTGTTNGHHHCIVCDATIADAACYRSGYRGLCTYCHSRFLLGNPGKPGKPGTKPGTVTY